MGTVLFIIATDVLTNLISFTKSQIQPHSALMFWNPKMTIKCIYMKNLSMTGIYKVYEKKASFKSLRDQMRL